MIGARLGVLGTMSLSACLAVAVAACGGSDDDGATAARGGDRQAGGGGTAMSEMAERKVVARTRARLEDELYSGDAKAYCAGLTRSAGLSLARTSSRAPTKTCEAKIRQLVPRPVATSARAAYEGRTVGVELDGDEAVVISRGADGRHDRLTFVKVGGEWKLDRWNLDGSGAGAGSGGP